MKDIDESKLIYFARFELEGLKSTNILISDSELPQEEPKSFKIEHLAFYPKCYDWVPNLQGDYTGIDLEGQVAYEAFMAGAGLE
jgi:hypothetical protein